jgi:phosphoesterase RecJ-like protein
MKQTLDTLSQILSTPKKIAIIIHRNPDGDAIGSGVALQEFLLQKKHYTTLISPNEVPDYLKWMPNTDGILIFEKNQKEADAILNEATLIFTLDFNDFSRTGKEFENSLQKQKDKTFVMIDHHLEPSNYAKFMFSDHHKSSTSEMVYEFIVQLSDNAAVSKDMATALYTGIMTDTGSFKFPNTTANTMRIAAELMDKGITHNKIQIKIYDSFTTDKLHLLGEALNKLVFLPEYKTAYIALTKAELDKHNYKKGDTEGFVNYGLALADSNFAVMFLENDNEGVRISFRSKGDFPANEFAKKYFNGGGHLNAAGGRTQLSIEDAVNLFKEKLPEFKEKLLATHV